ncbi:MFS transporter [Burkholderia cepacia]|uniref:MFS transporter n=2 Tax=Burkholderia cepacia complex TaxID=87882 RepID=UPI000A8074D3
MTNGAQYRPGRAWSIATMLALMMLVNFLDKVVLGLVSVPMMRDLHLSPTQFGVIGGSLNWLFAVAAVAGGIAANRWPAKWLLLAMAATWALLQLPMLVAGSIWVVIACRVLLGIGEGPASPVATHAIYKWFPDTRRNLPVALLHQGSALGLLIAGLSIPVITTHWGWRANFAVLALLGAVWCIAWAVLGEEGTLARAPRTAGGDRVPYGRLLTDRTVLGNFLGHFAANWILAMTLTWMPTYLQLGLGFGPHEAGRMFALFVAVTSPLSLALAWLSQTLLRRSTGCRLNRYPRHRLVEVNRGCTRAFVSRARGNQVALGRLVRTPRFDGGRGRSPVDRNCNSRRYEWGILRDHLGSAPADRRRAAQSHRSPTDRRGTERGRTACGCVGPEWESLDRVASSCAIDARASVGRARNACAVRFQSAACRDQSLAGPACARRRDRTRASGIDVRLDGSAKTD